ncbi:MAG TPA: hypothetical protein DCS90_01715 [Ktedonobacter sp.]|nr:hypothetical protein [Ktedonobacter sp.]
MAAKFDTSRAKARHQLQGDGAPILITMKVPHIWIPLEVLALDGQQVQADIYLLTDTAVNTSDVGAKVGQSAVGNDVPGCFRDEADIPGKDEPSCSFTTSRPIATWVGCGQIAG